MILVILGVCAIFLGLSIWYDNDTGDGVCTCVSVFLILIVLFVVLCLGINVSKLSVIDEKIEMYEQENTKIEQQIETAVRAYQEHEKEVLTSVKPDSYMQLVTLYPELKSDTLVSEQIKTYQENNKEIKRLKEKAINGNVKRWWLYFGHKEIKSEDNNAKY